MALTEDLQQRLWFLDQLAHAAGAAYHMASGWRLQGSLNQVALRAALDTIVARHAVLRTSAPVAVLTQAAVPVSREAKLSQALDGIQPGKVAVKRANRQVSCFSRDLQYETVREIHRGPSAIVA
jgi:hypothetical protein